MVILKTSCNRGLIRSASSLVLTLAAIAGSFGLNEEIATPPAQKPAPVMLAKVWDKESDASGWWMSEKLDGVRAYWTGDNLMFRSGNVIHSPAWFTVNFPETPLDGELWIGRKKFSATVSVVRRLEPGDGWRDIRYMIVDAPEVKGPFEERIDFARRWFAEHPLTHVRVLEQQRCRDNDHVLAELKSIEEAGGEGIILRRPGSPYTVGRSGDLLKVKSFHDAEARVIGYRPGSGRNEGRLGALLVQLPNGIEFAIGTGFSDAERDNPPPVGSVVTFRYQDLTDAGVPRFASFLRVREEF